MAASL